jgi:hypothetical protein
MVWFINIYVGWVLALTKIILHMITSHELRPALMINRDMSPKILDWFQALLRKSMSILEAKSKRGSVTVYTPKKNAEIKGMIPSHPVYSM